MPSSKRKSVRESKMERYERAINKLRKLGMNIPVFPVDEKGYEKLFIELLSYLDELQLSYNFLGKEVG